MIIIEPLAGLANKLRVIESSYNLSKLFDRRLLVLWNRNRGLNANFSELFEPIKDIIFSEAEIRRYNMRNLLIHILEFGCKIIPGFKLLDDAQIREYIKNDYDFSLLKNYKVIYIKTCMDFMSGNEFDLFRINQKIKPSLIENEVLKNTIGIHIRRTDNVWSIEQSPTDLFIKKCQHEISKNQNVKFYLATDDKKTENEFKLIFKERILVHDKTIVVRNTKEGIVDAVIDLYNLANCSKIYGTYKSSFSDIASKIGNIEKIVLTVQNDIVADDQRKTNS